MTIKHISEYLQNRMTKLKSDLQNALTAEETLQKLKEKAKEEDFYYLCDLFDDMMDCAHLEKGSIVCRFRKNDGYTNSQEFRIEVLEFIDFLSRVSKDNVQRFIELAKTSGIYVELIPRKTILPKQFLNWDTTLQITWNE